MSGSTTGRPLGLGAPCRISSPTARKSHLAPCRMSSPAARTSHLRTPPLSRAFSSDGALASAAATTPLPASTAYRVLLLAIAGSHVFLAAGVVFGWTSLAQILAGQGVGCDGDDCSGQPGVFAFVFTLGTVGSYTSNLPFG